MKKNKLSGTKKFGEDTAEFSGAAAKVQGWSKKYASIDTLPDTAIPDTYDLRNIDGYDFTGGVRD